jgi:hypothetical protein
MKELVMINEDRNVTGHGGLLYPKAGAVQLWGIVDVAAAPKRRTAPPRKPGLVLASHRLSTAELDREELCLRLRIAAEGGYCAPGRHQKPSSVVCPTCFTGALVTTDRWSCWGCGALLDRHGRVVA